MNKQTSIHTGNFSPWRATFFCTLLLALTLAFTGCATNETPKPVSAEQAHSESIILREGDELKISFPDNSNLDSSQQIRRDGKIVMPLVGEVQASGMTPDALRESLLKLYANQISSKEINVFVQSSTFPVFVTGAVIRPGKVLSDHPMTALEAVMEAGGFDYTTADLKDVKVIRNEDGKLKNYKLNLKKVLAGTDDKSFYLKPGDIIYVPERFQFF